MSRPPSFFITVGLVTNPPSPLAPLGPVATPPRSELPDGTRAQVLDAIAARAGGGTVDELAERVGVHSNSVRTHVAALVAAGLVDMLAEPPSGRGRPAHRYAVSVAGEALLASARGDRTSGGDEYRGLAQAFARHLGARRGAQREARAVGELWGAQVMAARPRRRGGVRRAVLSLLEDLGFAPVEESAAARGAGGEDRDAVLLRACPLLAAASENPDVICQVHLGLVAGARATLAPGDASQGEVQLLPFAQPGACRLILPG